MLISNHSSFFVCIVSDKILNAFSIANIGYSDPSLLLARYLNPTAMMVLQLTEYGSLYYFFFMCLTLPFFLSLSCLDYCTVIISCEAIHQK